MHDRCPRQGTNTRLYLKPDASVRFGPPVLKYLLQKSADRYNVIRILDRNLNGSRINGQGLSVTEVPMRQKRRIPFVMPNGGFCRSKITKKEKCK